MGPGGGVTVNGWQAESRTALPVRAAHAPGRSRAAPPSGVFLRWLPLEAAGIVLTWPREKGVGTLVAHVHPDHQASQGVARAVGFTATTTMVGEETCWQG